MSMNRKDFEQALRPIEPSYPELAEQGPALLPVIGQVVRGRDPVLAPRAVYVAAFIAKRAGKDPSTIGNVAKIITEAAASRETPVRIAAGIANHALPPKLAEPIAVRLLADRDAGVRQSAIEGMPVAIPTKVVSALQKVAGSDQETGDLRAMAQTLLDQYPREPSGKKGFWAWLRALFGGR